MKYFIIVSFVTLQQLVTPQMLRPPPFNFIDRPPGEIIDTGNFINLPPTPTVISEPPCNGIVPIPNVAPPSTTIITDCSPEICQNLANTIQLMIVCNLLQNSRSSELAMQLAAPILNGVMSSPVLSCGCSNPLSPSVIAPNYSPNVVTANYIPPNFAPNVYSPNLVINPSFVSPPSVISPNILPLPPRVIAPTNACPNPPQSSPANVNGLLNTLLSMLGNMQG